MVRSKETDDARRALVIAAQVATLAKEQDAVKLKADRERILSAGRARLAELEKGLATLKE